jgi:hypothetical protein
MSLTNILKRRGPNTDPCETPEETQKVMNKHLKFVLTYTDQSDNCGTNLHSYQKACMHKAYKAKQNVEQSQKHC